MQLQVALLDDNPTISITLGIVVGLLASFVQSLGLTIQRKSHVLNQALPEELRKPEHRRPLWLIGFAIFISSNFFGSVFQIASLPVVILGPLGAVSLLWNAFFARLILGDVFSPWMFIGTCLIGAGAVLIAIFGIVPEPTHTLEYLLALFRRPAFIVCFTLEVVATVVCLIISHVVEYHYSNRRVALPENTPPLSPLVAPNSVPSILTTATTPTSTVADSTERTALLDRKRTHARSKSPSGSPSASILSHVRFSTRPSHTPTLLAASYSSFSGLIAGMSLIFAKSAVELLLLTLNGDNQFWRWQAWVFVLCLAACALLQLWYMHKSLVLADPTLVCPLAFCFYNLSSILNSLMYYNQFAALSRLQLWLVILGIAVLLAGVWIVSYPTHETSGVDLGPWPDAERDADADALAPYTDDPDDEPLPMHRRAQTAPTPYRDDPESVIDLTTPSLSLSPARGRAPHRPGSPESPRRRRTTLGTGAAPMSPGGAPLPAFSIGLSPMSPGFALVPKDRRRRASGQEGSEAGSARGAGSVSPAVMRRSVSGDGQEGAEGDGLVGAEPRESVPARRWTLLRSVFGLRGGRRT